MCATVTACVACSGCLKATELNSPLEVAKLILGPFGPAHADAYPAPTRLSCAEPTDCPRGRVAGLTPEADCRLPAHMALRSLHEFAHPAIRTTLPSPQGGAPHGAGTRANSPTGQTGWQAGGEHTLQASSVRTIRRASRASAGPRQPRIPRAPHAPPCKPPGGASPPRPPALAWEVK